MQIRKSYSRSDWSYSGVTPTPIMNGPYIGGFKGDIFTNEN
jgi:hypothetical protein